MCGMEDMELGLSSRVSVDEYLNGDRRALKILGHAATTVNNGEPNWKVHATLNGNWVYAGFCRVRLRRRPLRCISCHKSETPLLL